MKSNTDVLLHYAPRTGIFGDPIPFFWKGEYHLFYQNSPDPFSFNTMRWAHIVSQDLLHWENLPDALIPDPSGPDAYGCWTGSVLHWKDTFHIFYTGCSEPDGRQQAICHATSRDLVRWQKESQNPVLIPFGPFSAGPQSGWRDPCIVRDENGFRMLITANLADKPHAFNGCIAELHSPDLDSWSFSCILYSPLDTSKMECPDLFELEGGWILLYSNYGVQVRWSENGRDHWKKANPSYFDNFRFYAAKTLLDDRGRRLCFGFISDRENRNDSSSWKWGGVLSFPRQIRQLKGKELAICAMDELELLRGAPLPLELDLSPHVLGNWLLNGDHLEGMAGNGQEGMTTLVGRHPDVWEVAMQLDLADCSNMELIFNCNPDFSSGYCIEINKVRAELALIRLFPARVSDSSLLQTFRLPGPIENKLHFRAVLDRTVVEIYINNKLCFSSRVYPQDPNANWWGLYSKGKCLRVDHIQAWSLSL